MTEETKKNPLQEWRENATEEEKREAIVKSAITRRKNAYEKRKVRETLEKALENKFAVRNQDGEFEIKDGLEAIALNLILTALEPKGKQVVTAYQTIRDTLGEKPTDKVEQDTSIEIVMSEEMKRLAK